MVILGKAVIIPILFTIKSKKQQSLLNLVVIGYQRSITAKIVWEGERN
jgi:hypothetical protein